MIESIRTRHEGDRLLELQDLQILDTPVEERFDRITRTAQRLFDVPIALISLVDEHRQWFKSRAGLSITQTPRHVSFCSHAILRDELMVVDDAWRDVRFADNPLVTGEPHIRFYAGAPLHGPRGFRVGTLCLIGHEARSFDAGDRIALRDMASWAEDELANVRLTRVLSAVQTQLSLHRQAGQQLQRLNERLTLAWQGGRVGAWDWDLIEGMSSWDEQAAAIHHCLPQSPVKPHEMLLQAVHPADAARVAYARLDAIKSGDHFAIDYRLLGRSGKDRHVYSAAAVARDAAGRALQMSGIVVDITAALDTQDGRLAPAAH